MKLLIRFKVMHISSFIYPLVVIILLSSIIFLSYRLIIKDPVTIDPLLRTNQSDQTELEQLSVSPVYKFMLTGGFPAVAADGSIGKQSILSNLWGIISRKDIRDPRTIMGYQMPYLAANETTIPNNAVVANTVLPGRNGVDRLKANPNEVAQAVSNENEYYEVSDEIRILIDQIEVDESSIELTGEEGPQVLIYHSHSREAYMHDPKNPYKEAASEVFRSNDLEHTVISVGEMLAQNLKAQGIEVLHDTTEHEQDDYNASYEKSLNMIKKRMEEYESLQMFIDVHRNGYEKNAKKNPDDEVVIINGERVAKLFVVIGTGQGVLGGFSEKPQWEENTKLAIKLTNKINELYPGLAKDILHKNGRFNQHLSTKAILVEIGSTFTTQNEAEQTTKYLAEALSKIIE